MIVCFHAARARRFPLIFDNNVINMKGRERADWVKKEEKNVLDEKVEIYNENDHLDI